ncbi:MAG: arylsulfatase [Akkermansiaceae bacterium]
MKIFPYLSILLWIFGLYSSASAAKKPNIVYLMMDEWGYYELSGLGHPDLKTPNIDKYFLKGGMRFTQALAGGPVCGPTRATLMLGQHLGHTSMRTNGGMSPIREDDITVAKVLHDAGYATGGFGKWGIGGRGTTGVPEKHGFDRFFGYYHQVHAHTYFPTYLIDNSQEVPLQGNTGSPYDGTTFAHDVIWDEAMDWLDTNKDKPFFLYLPVIIPHGRWGMTANDPAWLAFKDKPWRQGQKRDTDSRMYAAMMLKIDQQIGDLVSKLKAEGLEDNTILFLCGDNGGQDYFHDKEYPRGRFAPNVHPKTGVEFRGQKKDLWEGGLRVPMFVRWPGKIEAGATNDHLWYFPDIFPTLAELADSKPPERVDGISIVPTLLGKGNQPKHEALYWEFGGQVAVRMENWKAIKPATKARWQLYNLSQDISETTNLAEQHPRIIEQAKAIAKREHTPLRPGKVIDPKLARKDGSVPVKSQ